MKLMKLPFIICCFLAGMASAQSDINTLNRDIKKARPGDTLLIADGIYLDVELNLAANGNGQKPIVVKAATPGKVILSGASTLRLAGTGIEVSGLYFTNGFAPKGAVIEFRSGNEVATNCRVTNCTIDNYNPPSRDVESSWILLYGRNNSFDHNTVTGKLNAGVTFAVILDEVRNQENNHRIEYNYFGRRPNLGSNGGETIRVGTSQSSLSSSRTLIQNNFFEHCDGEVEVVSIKSCDNIISNNTFFESAGVLALRHGHRNIVEGNAFIGNGLPNTGGVRVINEGHKIRNNFFYRLTGDRFFAALAVMNAVPNSLPNRYHQVKDVEISGNTWVDCDHIQFNVGKDNERTLAPANVQLSNNVFYNKQSDLVYKAYDKTDGFVFSNNKVVTKSGKFSHQGFMETNMQEPKKTAKNAVEKVACGADWYRVSVPYTKTLSGKIIQVAAAQNSLANAVDKAGAGDIIELTEASEYFLDKAIIINKYLRIQGGKNLPRKPIVRYNGTKSKATLLTIADSGILELRNIAFDDKEADGKAGAAAAVAPAPVMKGTYSAFIDNCEFYNFSEASFNPFKAQKTTMADSLVFTNCLFRDMSGDAIYLAAEKEDAGKYSAEYVEIRNCAFYNVLGHAVDLYRGGSDESTTGPKIVVDHCVLEDVNNKERGAGMRLLGVQNITVKNTLFSNSGRGGASIRLDETNWDKIAITNCSIYNSGRVASFWGKAITGPMFTMKPSYQSAATYNFQLLASSPLSKKATDGKAIGLIN
ncbi:MAG: hypothetical protein JWP88_1294 [Flaviaesturariibacter sp.]|nr:hypothetical protein [Flaviaesturariibacter sp.]